MTKDEEDYKVFESIVDGTVKKTMPEDDHHYYPEDGEDEPNDEPIEDNQPISDSQPDSQADWAADRPEAYGR